MRLSVALILLCFALPSVAHATDLCEAYRNYVPQPDWYQGMCNRPGGSAAAALAKVGGAFSTFADSFNLNPASIPTSPGPWGVEYVGSIGSGTGLKNNFALIKGYNRFGAGISTNSDDTFYSNSQTQDFLGGTASSSLQSFVPDSLAPTINLGSALSIIPQKLSSMLSSNLGFALKYNKANGKFAPGGGISVEMQNVTLGLSMVRETQTQYAPAVTYYTFTVGAKFAWAQLEYIYLQNDTANTLANDPMHVLSMSVTHNGFIGTGALRLVTDPYGNRYFQGHLAAQYLFSRYFAAGYLLNYIPGCHSLGVQVFL